MSGRLHRSSADDPGVTRRRRGRGFEYRDARGDRPDETAIARIRSLMVPPAWRDVWICADPAVARASYVDPRVVAAYRAGHTVTPCADGGELNADPEQRARLDADVAALVTGTDP